MSDLDFTFLKEHLQYDAETGDFTWIKSPARCIKEGTKAGRLRPDGYINIQIKSKLYFAHRIAWFYIHEKWPVDMLDHINGIRCDNRLCNLREANRKQNMENRKSNKGNISGHAGVTWRKQDKVWIARIMHNKKSIHLGRFDNLEKAIQARKKAEQILFTHWYSY